MSAGFFDTTAGVFSIVGTFLAFTIAAFGVGYSRGRNRAKTKLRQEVFRTACAALEGIKLDGARAEGDVFTRGTSIPLDYSVTSTCDIPEGIWLGASLWDEQGRYAFSNVIDDRAVAIFAGTHNYQRPLTSTPDWKPGVYELRVALWFGTVRGRGKSWPVSERRTIKKIVIK